MAIFPFPVDLILGCAVFTRLSPPSSFVGASFSSHPRNARDVVTVAVDRAVRLGYVFKLKSCIYRTRLNYVKRVERFF